MKKFLYRSILFLFVFFQITIIYLYKAPQLFTKLDGANLTSASATLSNSRLSFRGGVDGTPAAGATSVNTDTTGNADNNTNHLFMKDTVCFADLGENGCKNSTTYAVSNIPSANAFTFTPGLAGALIATDLVIATQSSTMTVAFTTVNEIPINGDLFITIPAIKTAGKTCDGFPDTNTLANNGFDLKSVSASTVSVTGCTDGNWVATEVVTCGDGSTNHTIRIDRQTALCAAASAITVTIGSVINPAPVNTAHTQGTADIYEVNLKTRDGSDATLDNSDVKVAPVEGVFVSATVDETLSFAVAAVTADSGSFCGITRSASSPDSTVYSIPWGTVSSTYAIATHNAVQQLTVSTNALSGYKVYIEENDQMGRNGNVCTGATPSAGEFTFTAGTCIRDTLCQTTNCSHTAAYDWTDMATYVGFGYSLANLSGTDAKFVYNSSASPCTATAGAGNFCAKTPADQEVPENRSDTNAEIMTSSVPVSGSSVYACYRIAIGGTQPAGYYYNKIKYTAVSTF
ncbi:MAG: hypothetical protein Q7U68_04010 [Candidatus Roizmanbacteria bacterium]|nr:hypothetical protein [Candidatus Roizmanbacteria bacterium]